MFTNLDYQASDTVFIVGNGAIVNGWEPVKEAFERAGGIDELLLDPAEPFSYLVYELRVLARKKDINPSVARLYRKRYRFMNKLRRAIAHAFKKAADTGKICLKVPRDAAFKDLFSRGKTSIITTNWDTLLHRDFSEYPILSLHGWVNDARTLYLPSEITFEPYRDFRDLQAQKLSAAHRAAIELLQNARHVVLWGISLSMYDAEICVLLADTHSASRRYTVVNPCGLPTKRLQFLTGSRKVEQLFPEGRICEGGCCEALRKKQVRSVAA